MNIKVVVFNLKQWVGAGGSVKGFHGYNSLCLSRKRAKLIEARVPKKAATASGRLSVAVLSTAAVHSSSTK